MTLSQTFRFEGQHENAAPAYHLAMDSLPEWRIIQAGRFAILRHKYKSMPQPAQLLEWALEDEGRMESQAKAGGRTGLWKHAYTDENGYQFYERRQ